MLQHRHGERDEQFEEEQTTKMLVLVRPAGPQSAVDTYDFAFLPHVLLLTATTTYTIATINIGTTAVLLRLLM